MSRRTYAQTVAWRDATLKALAAAGVEAHEDNRTSGQQTKPTTNQCIRAGRATVRIYDTGSCAIGGPDDASTHLMTTLADAGLVQGWHPGSRGSGVVWVPVEARNQPTKSPVSQTVGGLSIDSMFARVDYHLNRLDGKFARLGEGTDLHSLHIAVSDLRNLVATLHNRLGRADER